VVDVKVAACPSWDSWQYRDVYQKWWSDLIGQRRLRDVDGPASIEGLPGYGQRSVHPV
jgi:hypothetical protein